MVVPAGLTTVLVECGAVYYVSVSPVVLSICRVTCPFPHGGEVSLAAGDLAESRCELDQSSFKRDCFQSASAYRFWRRKD